MSRTSITIDRKSDCAGRYIFMEVGFVTFALPHTHVHETLMFVYSPWKVNDLQLYRGR